MTAGVYKLTEIPEHSGKEVEPPDSSERSSEKSVSLELTSMVTRDSLSVLGLTYIVKRWEGSWWKGCCMRPRMVKSVLTNVSMHVSSGQLTALLGNSGSGKTSLLNVIANRASGQIVGGVYLNNTLMTEKVFQHEAGYVMQDDRLIANLTVRETLTFTASLKFAKAATEVITERVNRVIGDIGLRHVADNKVGGLLDRGISGGERRRVSIAAQLLQDPKLLLLDEPTTGLDSCTANDLVANLAELAKKRGKIIMMTIHQPRSEIFKLVDQVAILSQGELVYGGPSVQMVPYFTDLGYPCPKYSNPLDDYIDLASIDRRDNAVEEESTQRVGVLKAAFVHSTIFRQTLSNIHQDTRILQTIETFQQNAAGFIQDPPGFYFTFQALVWRMTVNLKRDRSALAVRLFQLGLFALFMWLFIFRLSNNQESIQDRIGLFFQSGQVSAYVGLVNGVSIFPPIRDLYDREARDGLYTFLVFILAYFVQILPFHFVSSAVFSSIVYWAIGLYPDAKRFGIYYSVVMMMHYIGEMLGVIFMGIFKSTSVATSVTGLVLAISGLIASGFLVSLQNMLQIFQDFSWANVFKYSSEIFMANEFHQLEFSCDEGSGMFNCAIIHLHYFRTIIPPGVPCLIQVGDDYLNIAFPDAVDNLSVNFAVMAGFVGALFITTLVVYKIRGVRNLH
ncbi:hypothetical protein CAPTEDRAFT_142325 [Capitella teleta]|uniref:ABC transporter domain-containing protein n=1 Tax=Capitella teleta TaxID=283909 RepID=R7TCX7_CAPTE|nr:hypothetical protein CAPTEDRAFT_142325 [Capitella teleta]|eukprot:ELT88926.1 hypothetical protein CAPTEDRAFT_142325 [Capitella teleta]